MPRRIRRQFTADFKAQVLRDLLTGKHSAAELCREHQLSASLLGLWKETALTQLAVLFTTEAERDPEQARLAELEQLVGRQALELEVLKKASRLRSGPAAGNGRLP